MFHFNLQFAIMKLMKVLAFLLSVIMLSVSLNVAAYDEVPTHICDDLDKCFFVEQNNLQDNQDIGIQATCTHGTIEVRKAGGYYTGSTPLYCNIWVQHYQVYCTTCGEIWATYDQYEPVMEHIWAYVEGYGHYCMICLYPGSHW